MERIANSSRPVPNLQSPIVDNVQPLVWRELVAAWSKDVPETDQIVAAAKV